MTAGNDTGGEAGIPVEIVPGALILRWGEGALLSADCNTGTRPGHFWSILISEHTPRKTRTTFSPAGSISSLDHGVYGRLT